jgi:hypothetical protein
LLTPNGADVTEVKKAARILGGAGFNVDENGCHHDLVLAVTSHTALLIAYTMVGVATGVKIPRSLISAGWFSRFSPELPSIPLMARCVPEQQRGNFEIPMLHTEELFALLADPAGRRTLLYDYSTRTAIRRHYRKGQDTDFKFRSDIRQKMKGIVTSIAMFLASAVDARHRPLAVMMRRSQTEPQSRYRGAIAHHGAPERQHGACSRKTIEALSKAPFAAISLCRVIAS